MGNILEVQYMSHRNTKQTIQMLPGGKEYKICSTGEIVQVKHGTDRACNIKGLYKTFANCRALINCNVTDVKKCKWITLTYKENMTDTQRLYKDFEKFYKRFVYYLAKNNIAKPEYIVMMEPQQRGAWHAHCLFLFEEIVPYIPNSDIQDIWSYGFTKTKKLDDVDNVGAYLTAYLGDMALDEVNTLNYVGYEVKEAVIEENGVKKSKAFIKGARLRLYPKDFKMIRHSRNIKYPNEYMCSQEFAEKKVLGATKTFEKTIVLNDDNDFSCVINITQYNKKINHLQSDKGVTDAT